MQPNIFIWVIALLSILFIFIRPFKWPEAYWASGGAVLLVIFGLVTPAEAWRGCVNGLDVYLFLSGMMLLAEIAREEKLFDWLAALAVSFSKGSPKKMFLLIYIVGTITTVFLSNDATAVVLTPAVFAATKAAKIKNPMPYLLICAFIANAASFVLPISNPANLVIYGKQMPPLLSWLRQYFIPSLVSIIITCATLFYTQRRQLAPRIEVNIYIPRLSAGAKFVAWAMFVAAILLLLCSAADINLGMPTAIVGVAVFIVAVFRGRLKPVKVFSGISWSVLPLVAGLFVIVAGLNKTGILKEVKSCLELGAQASLSKATWGAGVGIAVVSNVINNLPSGLIAGNALQSSSIPEIIHRAVLIGVDLGPNLSVTGSLATILWLMVLRREGENISQWQFLKLGVIVMTPTLVAAVASLWI